LEGPMKLPEVGEVWMYIDSDIGICTYERITEQLSDTNWQTEVIETISHQNNGWSFVISIY
jgi:hypothetical protein